MAGLFEAIGKVTFFQRKKLNILIQFTFQKNNLDFAQLLINTFKIGSLKINKNTVIWSLIYAEDVTNFLSLINGYLRTERYELFKSIFNYWRVEKIKPINTSNILSDAWLAGYSEFNSKFLVNTSNNSIIQPKFIIKKINNNTSSKRKYFNTNGDPIFITQFKKIIGRDVVKNTSIGSKNTSITYSTVSANIINKLLEYYQKFPLFSINHYNYKDFKNIIELKNMAKTNKQPISTIFSQVKDIKSTMNHKRTLSSFDSKSLLSFYSLPSSFSRYQIDIDYNYIPSRYKD